jgi:hypothetical protein
MCKGNTEAYSLNIFCRGKLVSITDYRGVLIALVIQYIMQMRCIFIVGLSASTTFFFLCYLLNCTISEKKKNFMEHKIGFDFVYKFCRNISYSKKSSARYCYIYRCSCKVLAILVRF